MFALELYVRMRVGISVSPRLSSWTPGAFYTHFYNHARRLRLEKLLCLELSRSSNGLLKPLLDPGGGFTSKTAARRFQK
jgi:hypothetical protein